MILTHTNSSFVKLSKSLAGFCRKHIIQHALLKIIGTSGYMLNKGNKVGEIVMEFSKAFDTLNHNRMASIKVMLMLKHKAYGFDTNAFLQIDIR